MTIETMDEFQKLGSTIEAAFVALEARDEHTEEYAAVVDQIVKLAKVRKEIAEITLKMFEATTKAEESKRMLVLRGDEVELKFKEANKPNRVSADTWAMVAGNLAGIVAILGYERMHVITSKALGFILRSR